MKTGIELIAEERQRQIDVEGWTPEHDAQHADGTQPIMEKTKLICRFIGLSPETKINKWPWPFKESEPKVYWCNPHNGFGRTAESMKYHSSWDWLMPLVEKVHRSKSYTPRYSTKERGVDIEIRPMYCRIELPDTSQGYDYVHGCWKAEPLFSVMCADQKTTLLCVYHAVVKYIEWYNTTTDKNSHAAPNQP